MSKPDKDPKGPKPHGKPTPEPIPEPATAVDIDGVVMYTRRHLPTDQGSPMKATFRFLTAVAGVIFAIVLAMYMIDFLKGNL